MRRGGTFLDSNIVVYVFDKESPEKRERAIGVIESLGSKAVVSTQVLQEFYVTATRKVKADAYMTRRYLEQLAELRVVPSTKELLIQGISTHERYGIHLYDALIIEAAAEARCDRVLSEDMQHGQVIKGVRIENPFLDKG